MTHCVWIDSVYTSYTACDELIVGGGVLCCGEKRQDKKWDEATHVEDCTAGLLSAFTIGEGSEVGGLLKGNFLSFSPLTVHGVSHDLCLRRGNAGPQLCGSLLHIVTKNHVYVSFDPINTMPLHT